MQHGLLPVGDDGEDLLPVLRRTWAGDPLTFVTDRGCVGRIKCMCQISPALQDRLVHCQVVLDRGLGGPVREPLEHNILPRTLGD